MSEFQSFGEIKKLNRVNMTITQKIHGSNAQILIGEVLESEGFNPMSTVEIDGKTYVCQAGSRTRWIYPGDDNYGFAGWVAQHRVEIVQKLGLGRHFGEWAGLGINSGEGLKEKTLVLFDHNRYPNGLPPNCVTVPVLYEGQLDLSVVDGIMADLKANGSKLVPGFMRPEGIVVSFAGQRLKKVFDAEETQWTKGSGVKNANPKEVIDYSHLLQPIRLEKLLSRDERYSREFPKSLPSIVKDYVADLLKEGEIKGTEDEVRAVTKGSSGQIFKFIKTVMEEKDVA